MAGKGFTFTFASDARQFLKGTRDVEQALDDVQDSLDDLVREADDAGRKTGQELAAGVEKGTKDAGDATERLERRFRDLRDTANTTSKRAGDALGDNVRRGADDAGEGLEHFKDESQETAREVAASFDGSFDSIAEGIQEVTANALGKFGALGAGGGLVAAAGLGILLTHLQQAAEKANELTRNAGEFALTMAEGDTAEDVETLRDRWHEVATALADVKSAWEVWQPRAITNAERFNQVAEDGTVSLTTLFDAFNDPNPARRMVHLRDALDQTEVALEDLNAQGEKYAGVQGSLTREDADAARALLERKNATEQVRKALEDQIALEESARAVTEALARAEGMTVIEYERRTQAQAGFNDALEQSADPVRVYEDELRKAEQAAKDAATAAAEATEDIGDSWEDFYVEPSVSVQDMIDNWLAQAETTEQFEKDLEAIADAGGAALAAELEAQGPEVAGAAAHALATSDSSVVQAAIQAHSKAMGRGVIAGTAGEIRSLSPEVNQAMANVLSGIPADNRTVQILTSFNQANADVRNWRPPTVTIPVRLEGLDDWRNYRPGGFNG